MWDIYKTQLPLVFALFPEETKQISETLVRTTEALGISPNCLSLTKRENVEDNQARGLTALVLMQAHLCGHDGADAKRVLSAMKTDIFHERNKSFHENGVCERYTHILDLADACHSASVLAKELSENELCEHLEKLSENYVNAYDPETGILSDKSEYYEGSKYNYSFRLCHNMDGRIAIAGGKEKFVKLLSDFFGYGKEPVNQVFDPTDSEYVKYGLSLGRFEGFNNEPDMETPYSFIYADRHDKLSEIVHAGNKYMYTTGDGAVPGNNDSGAMSSCFVWNSIGLFPECGRDRVLVGSPCVKNAKIHLSSGNDFEISTSGEGIYVKKALLNGRELDKMYFPLTQLMKGGKLEIFFDNNGTGA
jgi:putative alpha-1,2-mannosidase